MNLSSLAVLTTLTALSAAPVGSTVGSGSGSAIAGPSLRPSPSEAPRRETGEADELAEEERDAAGDGMTAAMPKRERFSYALGASFGDSALALGVDVDVDAVVRGVEDVLRKRPRTMSSSEVDDTLQELNRALMQQRRESRRDASGDLRRRTASALAANRQRPGVVELASGVQYEVLRSGTGTTVSESDAVLLHYVEGAMGGEPVRRFVTGAPLVYPLAGAPPAWSEVLTRVRVGSLVRVWVPPERDAEGTLPGIAPHSAVQYDLDLVGLAPNAR